MKMDQVMAAGDFSIQHLCEPWDKFDLFSPSKIKAKQASLAWTLLTLLLLLFVVTSVHGSLDSGQMLLPSPGPLALSCPWVTGVTSQMEQSYCGPGHCSHAASPCSVEAPTLQSSTGFFPCVLSSRSQMYHNSASHRSPAANASPPGVIWVLLVQPLW